RAVPKPSPRLPCIPRHPKAGLNLLLLLPLQAVGRTLWEACSATSAVAVARDCRKLSPRARLAPWAARWADKLCEACWVESLVGVQVGAAKQENSRLGRHSHLCRQGAEWPARRDPGRKSRAIFPPAYA